jgi:hypothetical protein
MGLHVIGLDVELGNIAWCSVREALVHDPPRQTEAENVSAPFPLTAVTIRPHTPCHTISTVHYTW